MSSNNAIREQCRKALNEILLRTSESAFQRKPHLPMPSRVRGRILDFGEELADFCKGERHMVPRTVFQVFADDRKELILQHFSSCWLEETVAYIREMHKGFHTNSPAAWPDTVDVVRELFGFNLSETPPIFQAWLGRALETEVRFLDRWIERGLPVGGLVEDWNKIASSLAQVFRRQLEKVLEELRREPSLARRSQPSELDKIPRESRGGRSQPNASPSGEFKHSIDYRLSLQREEALNDARRQLRLRSRLPIESPQPHHGAGSMPEKLTKKRDLSREFDQVNLTDRQRECISLWLEYELSVSAIAKKLGLSRKTIDEHLHAAQARFEREKGKQRVPGSRSGTSTRKPGRPPRLGRPFVECAGALWQQAMVDGHGNVSIDKLRQIASALDAANYLPPSAHLEPKYARPLKEFNSRNSNSKRGPVVTWSQLISLDDKEYLRGMRCLLSRCAKKRRFLVVRKLIADKKSRVA